MSGIRVIVDHTHASRLTAQINRVKDLPQVLFTEYYRYWTSKNLIAVDSAPPRCDTSEGLASIPQKQNQRHIGRTPEEVFSALRSVVFQRTTPVFSIRWRDLVVAIIAFALKARRSCAMCWFIGRRCTLYSTGLRPTLCMRRPILLDHWICHRTWGRLP